MTIDREISDITHRILSEEFDEYDPEKAQEAADEWVENAPGPFEDTGGTTFEVVETDGGAWKWLLRDDDGSTIVDSGRTFETRGAAFDAVAEFRQSIDDAPVVADDAR